MQLDAFDFGCPEGDLCERTRGPRRDAARRMRRRHPVADLHGAWPDARIQAAASKQLAGSCVEDSVHPLGAIAELLRVHRQARLE